MLPVSNRPHTARAVGDNRPVRALVTSGIPGTWSLAQVPDSVPGRADVLVEVVAAGLNRADLLMRSGTYTPTGADWGVALDRVGFEMAGVVRAVGSEVDGVELGDRVMAQTAVHAGSSAGRGSAAELPIRLRTPKRPGQVPDYQGPGQAFLVGDTGIEPVTSSVSSNHGGRAALGLMQVRGRLASVVVHRVRRYPCRLSSSSSSRRRRGSVGPDEAAEAVGGQPRTCFSRVWLCDS